jgi:iron complex outermembrane receptor protein
MTVYFAEENIVSFLNHRRNRAATALLVILLFAAGARASNAPTSQTDFTELTLEELDALSISAASKREQPLFETPGAVNVLLPVDIRRAGHTSVAEALRLVPGIHVTEQLPGRQTVGIRGSNGVVSTKLLVLVDGRNVYGPFYGNVDWSSADIQIDDLSRIEIVRGPGGTLWGAHAVNGIINVISKHAADTQGGVVSIRGGSSEAVQGHVRYGGRAGRNTAFRVYAGGSDTKLTPGALAGDSAGAHTQARFGVRTDSNWADRFQLTWQADHIRNTRTLDDDPAKSETISFLGRLRIEEFAGGDLQIQVYYDRLHSRVGISDQLITGTLPLNFNEDTSNLDFDLTHHVRLGTQNLIWGGGARLTVNTIEPTETLFVAEPRNEAPLYNLFIQDEIALTPKQLRLTLGAKAEHHATIGWQVLSNIRLAWLPNSRHTTWAAVSRAVRAPLRGEREVTFTLARIPASGLSPAVRAELIGGPDYQAEINNAHEIGWRWSPTRRFQTDVTGYYFAYEDVRNLHEATIVEPGAPPTVVQRYTIVNDGGAYARGVEASARWLVSDRWELNASVARGSAHTDVAITSPFIMPDYAIPDWLWHVRSWWQLPRDFEFSLAVYGVGKNENANMPSDGYLRLDGQLSWRPRPDLELTLGIQNANDPRHNESITTTIAPAIEVRRNVFARIQWRF